MATELTGNVEVIRVDELLDVNPSNIRNKKFLTDLSTDDKSAKAAFSVVEESLIHDNISEKKTAGSGNSYGHIDNKYPFVFPTLTTTERDAIPSPNTSMKIYNSTVGEFQKYNGVSWVADGGGIPSSLSQGAEYTYLGELLNESFPGTTLNASNWSGGLPAGVTVNDKLIVASGLANWSSYTQLTKHYLYEKEDIVVDFKAVTKAVGNAWGFHQSTLSAYAILVTYMKFDQYTGVVSFGSTVAANEFGTMQPIDFSVGDDIRITIKRKPTKTYVIVENLTNTSVDNALGEFDISKWGSGGYYRLTFLGGQQEFANINISSTVRNYNGSDGVVFMGNSIGNGFGLENRNDRWTDLIMKSQSHQFENLCVDSWDSTQLTALRVTELLSGINAKYLFCEFGRNDAARSTVLATFQANLELLATTAQGLGFEVVFISPFPLSTSDASPYVTYAGNAAAATGSKYINIFAELVDGSNFALPNLLSDGVHPNYFGHSEIARNIKQEDNELSSLLLGTFDNQDILFRGLGFSDENIPLLGITSEGVGVKLNPQKYINKTGITLQGNLDSAGIPFLTQNGHVKFSGKLVHSNEYIQIADNTGLKIGFNNGKNDTNGSNLQITNKGVGGVGFPQEFSAISGIRNILLSALSTKGGYSMSLNGDNNTILGTSFNNISGDSNFIANRDVIGLTSGSNNIGIGTNSLKGISTASNNIMLGTMSNNLTGNNSNRIMIGNFTDTNNNANTINISPSSGATSWYLGGSGQYATADQTFYIANNYSVGADGRGANYQFITGRGKGVGLAEFKIGCYNLVASGVNQSGITDIMVANRTRVTINNTLQVGRHTATEASALTASDADIIYVTSTDATFTSVGFWGYENSAWVKL